MGSRKGLAPLNLVPKVAKSTPFGSMSELWGNHWRMWSLAEQKGYFGNLTRFGNRVKKLETISLNKTL